MTDIELDVLVAEKVMGEEYIRGFGTPEYSTSIEAAWEVIRRFMQGGMSGWVSGDGHVGYMAGVTTGNGRFEALDPDSGPRAICIAALKSVGVEVPNDPA